MKKVFIDSNYDITECETPNSFYVDPLIANTIVELNKKGYYTTASCSMHYTVEIFFEESISKENVAKKDLMDWLTKNKLKFLKEDNDNYYYLAQKLGGSCYVQFKEELTFPFLPKGFDYDLNSVYKMISYYDNNILKSKEQIEEEINIANNDLLDWAKKLPTK